MGFSAKCVGSDREAAGTARWSLPTWAEDEAGPFPTVADRERANGMAGIDVLRGLGVVVFGAACGWALTECVDREAG